MPVFANLLVQPKYQEAYSQITWLMVYIYSLDANGKWPVFV